MKMYTLGHQFVPSTIHAGGLRYHGMAPLVSHAVDQGLIRATALHQRECFEAAVEFARTEGVVPAPESSHALAQVRREALACAESGEEKVIVVGPRGTGCSSSGPTPTSSRATWPTTRSEEALQDALAHVPVV
ncbi:MAG: hypothetical protein R2734_03335 [Nocardioides sp.]